MKAQEEALKIQKEQLELKEKQETALRVAQEKQAAKEAEEARAKQEALAQQAAAEAEKSAASESTVVAHQTESVLATRSSTNSLPFCWLFTINKPLLKRVFLVKHKIKLCIGCAGHST